MIALKCVMIGFAIDLAKWPIAAGGAIVDRMSSLGWTVGASTVIATTAAATVATVAPSVATSLPPCNGYLLTLFTDDTTWPRLLL